MVKKIFFQKNLIKKNYSFKSNTFFFDEINKIKKFKNNESKKTRIFQSNKDFLHYSPRDPLVYLRV